MSIKYKFRVVSFDLSGGQQSEPFRTLEEAQAFADGLVEEGDYESIYIDQILCRIQPKPAAAEDFGLTPGPDYPHGLSGRPNHRHAA